MARKINKDIEIEYEQAPVTPESVEKLNSIFDFIFELTLKRELENNNKNEDEKCNQKRIK
ncbi:MAG: hypothetical protein WC435_00800 [Candidatus Paceibacterota bacterium]